MRLLPYNIIPAVDLRLYLHLAYETRDYIFCAKAEHFLVRH